MFRRPTSSSLLLTDTPFESPVWANVSECRKERKAAKSADQISHDVQISEFECSICTIYIGHQFVEQEVYFLELPAGSPISLADHEYPQVFSTPKLFSICGGCAKRRHLPESACIIRAHDWTRLEVALGDYLSVDTKDAERMASVNQQLKTRVQFVFAQRTKAQERASGKEKRGKERSGTFNATLAMRTLPALSSFPSLINQSA